MKFERSYRIGVEDIGFENLATNKTILEIMEDIASVHSASVGLGVKEIQKNNAAWALLDWKVQVIRRHDYDEEVRAVTWSRKADRLLAYRDFKLFDKEDNLIAIGSSRWIYMNLEKRRPMKITADIMDRYESEDVSVFDEEITKIDISNLEDMKEITSLNYKLRRRDMDYNGHMHNISYIDIANEVLPEDLYFNKHFSHIRVEYKKEILKDDDVIVKYFQDEDRVIITFETENKINAVIEYMNAK